MGDGGPGQGDLDHVLLGIGDALQDRLGHFGSLAQAVAHGALAVADHYQGGELHDTAALNGLANPVQVDDFLNELGLIAGSTIVSHFFSSSLEVESPSRAPSASAATRP